MVTNHNDVQYAMCLVKVKEIGSWKSTYHSSNFSSTTRCMHGSDPIDALVRTLANFQLNCIVFTLLRSSCHMEKAHKL